MRTYPHQFAAFIVAAEMAWNGGATTAQALPYDPIRKLQEVYALPLAW